MTKYESINVTFGEGLWLAERLFAAWGQNDCHSRVTWRPVDVPLPLIGKTLTGFATGEMIGSEPVIEVRTKRYGTFWACRKSGVDNNAWVKFCESHSKTTLNQDEIEYARFVLRGRRY